MSIDRLLESVDLTSVHTFLTIAGMLLALFVMQQTGHGNEDRDDPPLVRWGHRVSLGSIALALLWSLSYSMTKNWQPWPPELALIMATIAVLSFRALAIHFHIRRGIRRGTRLMTPVGAKAVRTRN